MTQREAFLRWMRVRPELERVEYVNTWRRPDGGARLFHEMQNHPMDGYVEVVDRRRGDLWEML